jgi:hypothetical protein
VARPATRSTPTGVKRTQLAQLRDELPIDDRSLLILRVDRTLSWRDIALAFADHPEALSEAELEREVGRLRKRFQLIKGRLVAQVRRRLAS